MGSKTLVAAASLVLCFLWPTIVSAQTPHDAKQDAQIAQLQADVKSLTELVARQSEQVTKLEARFSTTVDAIRDQSAQTKALFEKWESVLRTLQDQSAQTHEILDAISGTDRSGNRVLKLLPIMKQSAQFRQEVSDAVHETMRQQGTVRIRNEMGTSNALLVNGQQYYIAPYATRMSL
jgi:ABC-type transporter Mla subunit MlaD